MMTTTMISAIARSVRQDREKTGGTWAALFVLVLGAIVAGIWWNEPDPSLGKYAGLSAAPVLLAFIWWSAFVSNLFRQSHPHRRQLVPRLSRSVAWAFVLGWQLFSMAIALFLSLAAGHWPAFWLASSVMLLCVSFAICGTRGAKTANGIGLALLIPNIGSLPAVEALWRGDVLVTAAYTACIAAFGLLTQKRLFLLGSEQSSRQQARFRQQEKEMKTGGAIRPNPIYDRRMARAIERSLSQAPDSKRRLVSLGFGPAAHPSTFLLFAALFAGLGLLLIALGKAFEYADALSTLSRPLALSGVVTLVTLGGCLPVFACIQTFFCIQETRREQALLALLPHTPAQDNANAWLAGIIVGRMSLAWLAGVGIITLSVLIQPLLFSSDSSMRAPLWMLGLGLSLCSLPAAAMLLRDYSRSGKLFFGIGVGAAISAGIAAPFAMEFIGIPIQLNAVAWVSGVAVLFLYRWRAMMRSPSALPAGRRQ